MSKKKIDLSDVSIELLQKLLIVELAKSGVPQNDIARIVGVASTKVNAIVKLMKIKEKQ